MFCFIVQFSDSCSPFHKFLRWARGTGHQQNIIFPFVLCCNFSPSLSHGTAQIDLEFGLCCSTGTSQSELWLTPQVTLMPVSSLGTTTTMAMALMWTMRQLHYTTGLLLNSSTVHRQCSTLATCMREDWGSNGLVYIWYIGNQLCCVIFICWHIMNSVMINWLEVTNF